jgi:hypothetical protein
MNWRAVRLPKMSSVSFDLREDSSGAAKGILGCHSREVSILRESGI